MWKAFDSYVEEASKKHAVLLALLHNIMKDKNPYDQVLEGVLPHCTMITWEKAQKKLLYPREYVICSKTVLP